MREVALAKSKASDPAQLTASSQADRFGLVVSQGWGFMVWLGVPFVLAWLVGWIVAGPWDRIPAILGGIGTVAFSFWVFRKGLQSESAENNFVELGEDAMLIQTYKRQKVFRVPYADIAVVRPVTHVSFLERWMWMIPRKRLSSCIEVGLVRPRWLFYFLVAGPWRARRLFLRLVEPTQFEFALKARLDRFRKGVGESLPVR
jgi:hypothetical protein